MQFALYSSLALAPEKVIEEPPMIHRGIRVVLDGPNVYERVGTPDPRDVDVRFLKVEYWKLPVESSNEGMEGQ